MVSDPPAVRPSVEAPPGRPRTLWLGLGAGALAVVLVAAAATAVALRSHKPPRGDVVMTLEARTEPPADALRRAAEVLIARLTGAGYDHPGVTVTGTRSLSVAVGAGGDPDGLRLLAQPGRLSFRAVVAGPTTPHAAPVPAGSAPAAVQAKLGPAYQVAGRLTDPGQVDPAQLAALAPFGRLTPDEVATLPATMQYAVPAGTSAPPHSPPPPPNPDPAPTRGARAPTPAQPQYPPPGAHAGAAAPAAHRAPPRCPARRVGAGARPGRGPRGGAGPGARSPRPATAPARRRRGPRRTPAAARRSACPPPPGSPAATPARVRPAARRAGTGGRAGHRRAPR